MRMACLLTLSENPHLSISLPLEDGAGQRPLFLLRSPGGSFVLIMSALGLGKLIAHIEIDKDVGHQHISQRRCQGETSQADSFCSAKRIRIKQPAASDRARKSWQVWRTKPALTSRVRADLRRDSSMKVVWVITELARQNATSKQTLITMTPSLIQNGS